MQGGAIYLEQIPSNFDIANTAFIQAIDTIYFSTALPNNCKSPSTCITGGGGFIEKYNITTCDQISCGNCPAGTHRSGVNKCTPCIEGRYANKPNQTFCEDCKPGYFIKEPGQTSCKSCEKGYYCPGKKTYICDQGSYTDQTV